MRTLRAALVCGPAARPVRRSASLIRTPRGRDPAATISALLKGPVIMAKPPLNPASAASAQCNSPVKN
jgi:hypothetical protein